MSTEEINKVAKFDFDKPINGIFYTYYNNDKIRSYTIYKNNDPVGKSIFYDINGKVELIISYKKGKPVKFEDYK